MDPKRRGKVGLFKYSKPRSLYKYIYLFIVIINGHQYGRQFSYLCNPHYEVVAKLSFKPKSATHIDTY